MFELRPRLFVETLEGAGRVLLHDYTTAVGALGMPADSRNVVTVGAADRQGQAEPYSAGGSPFDVALLVKPDVLAYDQVEPASKEAVTGNWRGDGVRCGDCRGYTRPDFAGAAALASRFGRESGRSAACAGGLAAPALRTMRRRAKSYETTANASTAAKAASPKTDATARAAGHPFGTIRPSRPLKPANSVSNKESILKT